MSDSRWKKDIQEIRRDLARLEATVAKLQGQAEEPEAARPKPEHEVDEWFVEASVPRWVRHITGRYTSKGQWRYAYDYYKPGGSGEYHEDWFNFTDWLPIPPRPAKPWGHKLTGEVRVPEHGESYVKWQGQGVGRCDSARGHYPFDHEVYGQRRWIAEAEAPAYRKGQLVCVRPADGERFLGHYIGTERGYVDICAMMKHEYGSGVDRWLCRKVRPAVASDLTPEQWMEVAQDLIDAQGDRTCL